MKYLKETICKTCNKKEMLDYKTIWYRENQGTNQCRSCANKQHKNNKGRFSSGQMPWNKGLVGYGQGHPPRFIAIGDKNPAWKGGITPKNKKIRNSSKYDKWRESVFKRDNYTCQICFIKGVKLNADHIMPFSLFPQLRFKKSNGRTLCVECHRNTDTFGGRVYGFQI